MHISLPRLSIGQDLAKLSATISWSGNNRVLWYSLPTQHADWFSTDRCDGFLVGMLLQAMELQEDIELEGPISSRLYHSLENFFIPMMSQAFPNRYRVYIKPKGLIYNSANGQGVCTGFSGGIDSFAAIIQHYQNENSKNHKISHLLFHNVGSHGIVNSETKSNLFRQRLQLLKPFSTEIDLPIVAVDSNLNEFPKVDFVTMHSTLNASIPLVLQNKFQRYYYASAYKYADCSVMGIDDIAHFDPFAFHLLSTESLDCISTGCQLSRVEKTKLVSDYKISFKYLNVCVDPEFKGRNCSVCFKCIRTILTLELIGAVHLYSEIFDLEKFSKIRARYVRKLMLHKAGSFEAEIADLYREKRGGFVAGVLKLRRFLSEIVH